MGIWKNSVTTFFSVLNRLILKLKYVSDNEIGCVKCMCGTGGQEPVIRQKEQGTLGKLGSKLSGLFGR